MKAYFYGWYLKCQSNTQTLAIIPAVHEVEGKRTYSIQIITEDEVWNQHFEEEQFSFLENEMNFEINSNSRWRIGNNVFGKEGLLLDMDSPHLKAKGVLRFSDITPIKYDIMGPFAFVPYMECRHSVYSMQHRVDGMVTLNGKVYRFQNALGYWEGDRGRSFPKEYAWTQCFLEEEQKDTCCKGGLMLSVADIPLAGLHFTGIIGIVRWKGEEYRFATYLGARVVQKSKNRLLVRQGAWELEARLLEETAHTLQAPVNGAMSRKIRENVKCKAFYRLRKHGQTVFAVEMEKASFEFEYK